MPKEVDKENSKPAKGSRGRLPDFDVWYMKNIIIDLLAPKRGVGRPKKENRQGIDIEKASNGQ